MVTVSPALGFKRILHFCHLQAHASQHVGQHMVGFDLEVICLQFDGDMAIAQVVSRTHEVKRRAVVRVMGDAQHRLRRCHHFEQGTVFAHQHITPAHGTASGKKHTHLATGVVMGFKPTFLTHIPIEGDTGRASEQGFGQSMALPKVF